MHTRYLPPLISKIRKYGTPVFPNFLISWFLSANQAKIYSNQNAIEEAFILSQQSVRDVNNSINFCVTSESFQWNLELKDSRRYWFFNFSATATSAEFFQTVECHNIIFWYYFRYIGCKGCFCAHFIITLGLYCNIPMLTLQTPCDLVFCCIL